MTKRITAFKNRSEACHELYRYAARFGFDRLAYVESFDGHQRQPAGTASAINGAPDWTAISVVNGAAMRSIVVADLASQCPVSRYCLRHDKPFVWRHSDDMARAVAVEKFMRRFNMGGAITTPLHQAAGGVGIVTWITSDAGIDLHELVEKRGHELERHARQFLQSLRVLEEAQLSACNEVLTSRELECLRWTALGKTTDEVGELISRSGETARFHLKSAIRKLGATSRIHAVARASYYGLLGDVS